MTVEGIDISHWQAKTPPLGNIGFVFVKATEGTAVDPMWATHSKNVRDSGAVLGAYHYSRDDVSIAAQAKAFLATAGPVQLLALDVEGPHAFSRSQTSAFLSAIHVAGRRCGLYMSESGFYLDVGQDFNWVANWSDEPRIPHPFWQYDNGSNALGVDRDRFSGTMLQLRRLAGLAHWRWVRKPAAGKSLAAFIVFDVDEKRDLITRRHVEYTASTDQPCTPPQKYHLSDGREFLLVRLLAGDRKGAYVHARWAKEF